MFIYILIFRHLTDQSAFLGFLPKYLNGEFLNVSYPQYFSRYPFQLPCVSFDPCPCVSRGKENDIVLLRSQIYRKRLIEYGVTVYRLNLKNSFLLLTTSYSSNSRQTCNICHSSNYSWCFSRRHFFSLPVPMSALLINLLIFTSVIFIRLAILVYSCCLIDI